MPDSACSGRDKTCKNYKRGTKYNHSRKGNLDRIAVEYVYQGDEISLKITKTPTKTNSIIKLIKQYCQTTAQYGCQKGGTDIQEFK